MNIENNTEENVKNTFPKPNETAEDNCSWCDKTLIEFRYNVNLRSVKGKIKYVYSEGGPFGGTEGLPGLAVSDASENPYKGLDFCSLKCLNELATSQLTNNKYDFINSNCINPLEGLDRSKTR